MGCVHPVPPVRYHLQQAAIARRAMLEQTPVPEPLWAQGRGCHRRSIPHQCLFRLVPQQVVARPGAATGQPSRTFGC
jgi:hypothetical protein